MLTRATRSKTIMILAAMGFAALASPVMAQTSGLKNAPLHKHAYGYAAHQAGRLEPSAAADTKSGTLGCTHVPFPTTMISWNSFCSGGS
jgi:hypothetical protein